jgi:hypothetical protein
MSYRIAWTSFVECIADHGFEPVGPQLDQLVAEPVLDPAVRTDPLQRLAVVRRREEGRFRAEKHDPRFVAYAVLPEHHEKSGMDHLQVR